MRTRRTTRLALLLVVGLAAGLLSGCTAPPTGRFLYVVRAPYDRDGFRDLQPSIEVHDIDDGHRLVRVIPLPETVKQVRGVAADEATDVLYVSHFGRYAEGLDRNVGGKLLAFDLKTERPLWERIYKPGVDRFALTPDGAKIYMPQSYGSPDFWTVIDARTGDPTGRITHIPGTHNTIASRDGRRVFLQGLGLADPSVGSDANGFTSDAHRMLAVADTATDQIVQRIGPFREVNRPFTVNGAASLVYMTVNDLIGFQVGDVATGRVLHTAMPPAQYRQPPATNNYTLSHGIALTADNDEVYVVDQSLHGLHVFDVRGVPSSPPRYVTTIKTRSGSPEIYGQPAWIGSTIDGRYLYPESGEIVDTETHRVVGALRGASGTLTHSRNMLEVRLDRGDPVAIGDQFGVGR